MHPMFDSLSREEKLLLLQLVCSLAWADMEIRESERRFIERLVDKLELDAEACAEARAWLQVAPSPHALDTGKIPKEHRRAFIATARALIYVDGDVDADERAQLDWLQEQLGVSS